MWPINAAYQSSLQPVHEGLCRTAGQLRAQRGPVLLSDLQLQSQSQLLSQLQNLQRPDAHGRTQIIQPVTVLNRSLGACGKTKWRKELRTFGLDTPGSSIWQKKHCKGNTKYSNKAVLFMPWNFHKARQSNKNPPVLCAIHIRCLANSLIPRANSDLRGERAEEMDHHAMSYIITSY